MQHAGQLDVVDVAALARGRSAGPPCAASGRSPTGFWSLSSNVSARSCTVVVRRSRGLAGVSTSPASVDSVVSVTAAAAAPRARRPSGPSGRSWRSRCTGRSGRRWPRGSPSSVGSGLRSSSARAVIIMPGVQKPHCRPWHCMKPCWTGSSSAPLLEALDGAHLVAAGHRGQHGARLDRLAVQPDHAGAAVAGVAAPVGAGQAEVVAQEVHQQQPALDLAGDLVAVDGHRDLHAQLLARGAGDGAAQRAAGQLVGEVPLVLHAAALVGRSGRSCCAAIAPASVVQLLAGRLPAQRLPRSPAMPVVFGPTAASPTRASAITPPSQPDRGAGRDHGPVAGPALDLLVRADPPGPDREPDLDEHLVVADGGLVRARGGTRPCVTTRSPPAPRITHSASSVVHTADRSSDGSAWHSEPPSVPRLRTTGSAITRSASRKIGKRAASASDSSSSRCRVSAPIRICVRLDRDVAELVVQVVDVDQVLEVGQPQLHHRQQAVPAGDEPGSRCRAAPAGRWRGRRWWRARTRTGPEPAWRCSSLPEGVIDLDVGEVCACN